MDSDWIVRVKGVYFSYGGDWILEDINLEIIRGDFWAIFGPNGGGKTTLLKIILGLLSPQRGEILYNFKSSFSIGYLPQNFPRRAIPMKVIDLVLSGLISPHKWGFWHKKDEIKKAEAVLDRVDMLKYRDMPLREISGGQMQRVFMARALISDPELLVLDEPTSNIDPGGRFCFYDFLSTLGKDITVVMVSHDLSLSVTRVNKIACVNKRLVISSSGAFTKEMLGLIYGIHQNHSCPVSPYYRDGRIPFSRQMKGDTE